MRNRLCALSFASMAWLCGCSEFYGVGVSHGEPVLASGDTLYIPVDTVSIPGQYASTDTLWHGELVARPGRVLTMMLKTGDFSAADSIALLASFASADSLAFSVVDSTGRARTFSRTERRQGDNYRQDLTISLQSSSYFALSWVWPSESEKSQALVALAYSPKALENVLSSYEVYESQALKAKRPMVIDSSSWSWQLLPVVAGDRITIALEAAPDLEAYLVTSATMASFIQNPSAPAQTLYSRAHDGDAWELNATEADTLYWLMHNPTRTALEFQDSLLARLDLTP